MRKTGSGDGEVPGAGTPPATGGPGSERATRPDESGAEGGSIPARRVYLGTFLIALSTLALEILVTRLLSVVTWYHLAFFAISTAMLGMTAGALRVYLDPGRFEAGRLPSSLSSACRGFALVVPATLLLLCSVPLQLGSSSTSLLILAAATVACAAPFYFSGVAVAAVLSRSPLPVARVYAADLVGASAGCLLVLLGLELADVPSLVILTAAGGALAAYVYAPPRAAGSRSSALLAGLLAFAAASNALSSRGIQPIVIKGIVEDPHEYVFQNWNSYSRVVVYRGHLTEPAYWGPSPLAPKQPVPQFGMRIDGLAGTSVRAFRSRADIEHLRYDVTNVAYFLRPTGGAAVVGVGGGRDVQSALLFGHERVDAIEVNPFFVSLLRGPFRAFAGLADHSAVSLHVDEARAFLSRSDARYRLLQMSLIDTWAATGAGAYSLSENGLYTVEAWRLFLDRLTDDGIFTVSRWYDRRDLGETGRVVSLAVATLLERGARDPSSHLALVTAGQVATLVLGRSPLTPADVDLLRQEAARLSYDTPVLPGAPCPHPVLRGILSARSREALSDFAGSQLLDYRPPTDDSPFFFNMLPLRALFRFVASDQDATTGGLQGGVLAGNLVATKTLAALVLCLFLLTTVTVLAPLTAHASGARAERIHVGGAFYFSLIGAGFMFAEIALIQRLSVFLGHPAFALGVLLFTIICSTGVGSFLSDRLPLSRGPLLVAFPLVTATGLAGLPWALDRTMRSLGHAPEGTKIAAAIALLFPLGILLGLFFPTGMRLARLADRGETPWYWALNGAFGVLSSALAVAVAIYSAISTSFRVAALCYLLTLPFVLALARDARERGAARAG